MSELLKTIKRIKSSDSQKFALATIISTEGSSYRRAGAGMLIDNNGRKIGSISGGCLERDENMRQIMISGKPIIVSCDATTKQDIVFGTGSDVNGVVRVLLSRFVSMIKGSIFRFYAIARLKGNELSKNILIGFAFITLPPRSLMLICLKIIGSCLKPTLKFYYLLISISAFCLFITAFSVMVTNTACCLPLFNILKMKGGSLENKTV